MSRLEYNINDLTGDNIPGIQPISEYTSGLINKYTLESVFNREEHYIELHILDLENNVLRSELDYTQYKELGNSQSAGNEGASIITVDPLSDAIAYGYESADVKLTYHFLKDLFATGFKRLFFIKEISPDRTELLVSVKDPYVSDIGIETIKSIQSKLQDSQWFFNEFRINFQDNNLLVGTNIDIFESDIIIKLYNPLPLNYDVNSTFNVVELVANSALYEVSSNIVIDPEPVQFLRPANFNIEDIDEQINPTSYFNYNELYNYATNSTNSKILSTVKEKGIELGIDYSLYSNFINFSSAAERLQNFKYKLQLLEEYTNKIQQLESGAATEQQTGGSILYFNNLSKGILESFDHYERYLYYEASNTSWPKDNDIIPYVNSSTTSQKAIRWFSTALQSALDFDNSNYSNLANTIPLYLREDPANEQYLTFIYMIGHHFDNLWIYSKQLSEKYNTDNRLNVGISKDLVGEVLKNFGIKLYSSNKSTEDLFISFIEQSASTSGENIEHYITGSVRDTGTGILKASFQDYQREFYKRLYHNLPLLLKSKGTERGLRALINCFGIPSDILKIKLYGGVKVDGEIVISDSTFVTSSLGKIRIDNQGTTLPENTLSSLTRTHKSGQEYTKDSHVIEVGFSPVDDIDSYIKDQLTPGFDLDDYLGDPRNLYRTSYDLLLPSGEVKQSMQVFTESLLQDLSKFNLKDYVRLIKFFDNTLFKMIKDFIPARSTANVGVIIKPHVLDRSKIKSTQADVTFHHYSGSIEVENITGNHGNTFGARDQYSTLYTKVVQTPEGLGVKNYHIHETAKYDGELANNRLAVSSQDLNTLNNFKYDIVRSQFVSSSILTTFPTNICNITVGMGATRTITGPSGQQRNLFSDFTNLGTSNIILTTGSIDITSQAGNYIFPSVNYTQYQVTASNASIVGCSGSIAYNTRYCDLSLTPNAPSSLIAGEVYDLTTWFVQGTNTDVSYKTGSTVITFPNNYQAPGAIGSTVVISLEDNQIAGCTVSNSVTIIDSPFECTYLVRFGINIPYKYPGEFPSEENPHPFEYTYIPYNNGLGGPQVTVLAQLEDKVQAFTVNEQIVEGSLHVDVPPNWVVTPAYTSCS